MCHELLCCFGHSEPEKRPPSGREEAASSPPKPSAAINGGVQAPSQQNKATINQDETQDQEQIKNGNNREKPMSSPFQGEKQQNDNQDQQNGQEQDRKKQSKIAKVLSFKPKGSKAEKPPRVPPENHKSSEEKQKVLAQDVFPKGQENYSPKEQDLGTKKPATSNKEQHQIPSPPKEQVHPPKEETDQKTKILFAKGN
ncbi:hypothetical protein DsansV1_C11g0108061 [Dioscorea sansibarensis]